MSHGGSDGGALNSRYQSYHVLMPAGHFLDENWSMARLNVHVAPRHAPLHVVSCDFLDFDTIPTCHQKKTC